MAGQFQCWSYCKVGGLTFKPFPHIDADNLSFSAWGADGKPVPLTTGIKLAGTTWDLFKGPNGQMTVFSFLPSDGKNIASFKGDINVFLKYLTQSQGVASTQYLKSFGAGTEPTMGDNAVFTTSKYTVDVKYS